MIFNEKMGKGPFGKRNFGVRGPFGHGGPFGKGGPFARGHKGHRGMGFGGVMEKIKGKFLSSEEMHLLLLDMMSGGAQYGYEIIKSVSELSSGTYAPSPGMIYPLLSYLVEIDHATSQADGNRKNFKITEEGSAYLETKRAELEEIKERIKIYGEKLAGFQKRMAEEDFAEDRWGRGKEGAPDFEMRAKFQEVRHQLREALFSKRSASIEEKQRVLDVLRRALDEINKI